MLFLLQINKSFNNFCTQLNFCQLFNFMYSGLRSEHSQLNRVVFRLIREMHDEIHYLIDGTLFILSMIFVAALFSHYVIYLESLLYKTFPVLKSNSDTVYYYLKKSLTYRYLNYPEFDPSKVCFSILHYKY